MMWKKSQHNELSQRAEKRKKKGEKKENRRNVMRHTSLSTGSRPASWRAWRRRDIRASSGSSRRGILPRALDSTEGRGRYGLRYQLFGVGRARERGPRNRNYVGEGQRRALSTRTTPAEQRRERVDYIGLDLADIFTRERKLHQIDTSV